MKNKSGAKHVHEFTRRKPSSTVDTCYCGQFRHNENNKNPIVVNRTYCAEHNDGTVGCEKQPRSKPSAMELDYIEHGYSKEAAKFMVSTLNNRDELVRAVKNLLELGIPSVDDGWKFQRVSAEQKLRKAIAKAEGK